MPRPCVAPASLRLSPYFPHFVYNPVFAESPSLYTSLMVCIFMRRDALLPGIRPSLTVSAFLFAIWSAVAGLASAAHLEDRILAVVNSDLIMMSDVKQELEPERQRIARQHRGDELAQRLRT